MPETIGRCNHIFKIGKCSYFKSLDEWMCGLSELMQVTHCWLLDQVAPWATCWRASWCWTMLTCSTSRWEHSAHALDCGACIMTHLIHDEMMMTIDTYEGWWWWWWWRCDYDDNGDGADDEQVVTFGAPRSFDRATSEVMHNQRGDNFRHLRCCNDGDFIPIVGKILDFCHSGMVYFFPSSSNNCVQASHHQFVFRFVIFH